MIFAMWTLGVCFGMAAVLYFIAAAMVADRVVRPSRAPLTRVISTSDESIELEATPLTRCPGPIGALYKEETRHVFLGEIIRQTDASVTRRFNRPRDWDHEPMIRAVGDPFGTPQLAGLVAAQMDLRATPDSRSRPTWRVLPQSGLNSHDWAIHIHGMNSDHASMLRSAAIFSGLGYSSLIPSYGPDGATKAAASALGMAEWRDIEPAVEHALQRGARRVLLVGQSLGGTIALQFMQQSKLSAQISGLALVAPVVDWRAAVISNAHVAKVPTLVARTAIFLLSHKASAYALRAVPINFDLLTPTAQPPGVPTLIIHAAADPVAPVASSRVLGTLWPQLVTLVESKAPGHCLEWNHDPQFVTTAVEEWVSHLK